MPVLLLWVKNATHEFFFSIVQSFLRYSVIIYSTDYIIVCPYGHFIGRLYVGPADRMAGQPIRKSRNRSADPTAGDSVVRQAGQAYGCMFGRSYHRSYSRLQGQRKPLYGPIIRPFCYCRLWHRSGSEWPKAMLYSRLNRSVSLPRERFRRGLKPPCPFLRRLIR